MTASQYDDLIPLGRAMPLRVYLQSLWERRQFAITIPLGELRAQNMNTVLGNVWLLLSPTLLVCVYYLIFGILANRVLAGITNVIGFLTVGIFTYQYLQRTVVQCSQSIVSNEGLIRSLAFPRAILPISTVVRESLAFYSSMLLMFAVVVAFGERPNREWLQVLAIVPMMALFALGFGFMLARLTDSVQDVRNLLPFMFRLLFYLSGIIFVLDNRIMNRAPEIAPFVNLNPFFVFPALMRDALMSSYTVIPEIKQFLWPAAIVHTLLFLTGGFLFFRAAEQRYGRG
jgi:teichoic acid transport system permease protein